ncbi:AAA family ATPase [Natronosporangium hydrolyticum]|uniref:AAA family ATPase n=1 Tax=Natronosporangium hydrolyticum TaxID=2811111 RepID=A0A895YIB3_9ACTN|nr:AAA family ATPase [Natronosporangium hydrolyticum]QSB15093.1 AAA family ATPase [Natronosporangium hydrolyticum]
MDEGTRNLPTPQLVGREHPLAVLTAELQRTLTSHGGLTLLTGEPGIGKTRLAGELVEQARAQGALVASGSAWEAEGAPGFWPWVQVLRSLRRDASDLAWGGAWRAAGEPLAHLLGEAVGTDLSEAAGEAAFAVSDAVTTLLVTLSRDRPVVVFLDDLHWADAASVKLLEFVANHTWFERVLVVAGYRDVEVERADHPLQPLFAGLTRRATMVTLAGLTVDQTAAVFAGATGQRPDPQAAALLHRRTGGNPFFVEQAARLRASGGQLDAMTPQIGEALESRLRYVSPSVRDVLTAAAVIGREFEPTLLSAAAGCPPTELAPLLAEAEAARLVTRLPPPATERYAFVHDLIRESRYAALPESQRRKRHAAVAQVLRELPEAARRPRLSSLAHHAYLAVPEIAPEEAVAHLLAAADNACERMAGEEVVRHYRRALELTPAGEARRRATVALELAGFQAAVGDVTGARQSFEAVTALARELADPELLAQAALGWHELGRPVDTGRAEIELMDEAAAALVATDAPASRPLLARVLAAAGRARVHAPAELAHAQELTERALRVARETGDPAALGFALLARHDASWRPGTADQRRELVAEMQAVAEQHGDEDLALQARLLEMAALLEQGDPAALSVHAAFVTRAQRSSLRRWHYHAQSRQGMIATLTGAFEAARVGIDCSYALAMELGEADADSQWREQRWQLALLAGDFDEADRVMATGYEPGYSELVRALIGVARGDPDPVGWRIPSVLALAEEAPPMFVGNFHRPQAQFAAASGDPELCQQARAALAPYRGLWLVVAGGSLVLGPYAYWLARLDAAERRWADAVAGFDAARAAAERLHARPWAVEAKLELARALRGRGGAGDRERAAGLLPEVTAEAEQLGMRHIPELAAAESARLADESGGPRWGQVIEAAAVESGGDSATSTLESPAAEFRYDGRVWVLSFAGRTVHLPAAKGLNDLRVLLGRPGVDVPATELLNPAGGEQVQATGRLGADLVLDERAKLEYRRRLEQLDEEIDRAAQRADDQRAAELDQERAALIEQLRTAAGLGGRPRRLGDQGERARKTVTARIRDTLRRLDQHHPELAEHLRASISTGVTCRYQPARRVGWRFS